jgi:threonine dehydrogenase-like Zn-dependent dehydrogenase
MAPSAGEAAAVPVAATTALRGIRDVGEVTAGQRVLVNGASGGVGTYAVQIAAALGAEVTGVCSTRNVELVRSIGAAHVIDYTTDDFTDGPARYDVIFDNVSNLPLSRLRGALTPKGTLVINGGGSPGHVFGPAESALKAEGLLTDLAAELDKTHPGAAASLREGMAETLTILRLGVPPTLARTLRSTNPVESMIEICREHSKNVKRWRDGTMVLRWCAAGMLEAGHQFRRVNGHLHLPKLRAALEAHFCNVSAASQNEHQKAA